ncbi:MAG TPA: FAD-dependent oxidoreductase [Gemmatimonadaceae bacterium]|nr:FAD-dependent oxidoreductase [Gemmatimonadaceae bacterium]
MTPTVLILGGGVAGMSAAHELVERGYRVTVLEKRDVPGGKARSLLVPDSAVPPNAPLPGEHGFRFFPHFYRHIIDTMARTPVGGGRTAVDNLVYANRELLGRFGYPPITFPAHAPRTMRELAEMLRLMFTNEHTGLTEDDMLFFADRLWRLMTACPARSLEEYENESWWAFMDADHRSAAFRHYFVEGLTRCLVAAKAKVANVRAGGVVLTQLVYGSMASAPSFDRLLNGPTTEVWIHPWRDYLAARGVEFRFATEVAAIECDGRRITGVRTRPGGGAVEGALTADHYICALPIEYTAPLLTKEILAADPALAGILRIAGQVYDMTGIQFYLEQDVPLVKGHMSMIDTPWALTGISQRQFWPGIDFAHLGDGRVNGILSIDISEWDTPGLCFPGPDGKNKTARQCTKDEVAEDVWTQMRKSLTQPDGGCPLPERRPRFFIDPGMVFDPTPVRNENKLFVNEVGSWKYRPEAHTAIPNFALAADYVRTFTNLATMEAANEAARRAVNAILDADGSAAPRCEIWPLYRPPELWPLIQLDKLIWAIERAKRSLFG